MKIEPLLKRFDELAEAPERIPSLRRVIFAYLLHSAVNSPDAIARAASLREAHEIRQRELVKNTNPKTVAKAPDVEDEDLPPSLSDIPTALFAQLGNIATIEKGLSQIQRTKPGKYPLVVTAETRSSSESFDFEGAAAIIPLVSSTGHGDASLKRLHYQEGRYAVGNILAVVKPICPDLLRARFIYEYLSAFKEELLVSRMVGTANVSLTVNKLKEVPVPLVSGPIISRIDELMALCDQLEAQQQERETKHTALAQATLARFAEAPTPTNLNLLFHSSFSIQPSDLRKTILTLAVQGKLVPQDPKDESAQKLSDRIRAKKSHASNKRASGKPTEFDPIEDPAKPYMLPEKWAWVPLGNVTFIRTGKLDANASSPDGKYPFFTCAKEPLRIDRFAYDGECVLLAGNGNFDVNYYDGKFEAYQRTYIIEGVGRDLIDGRYLFRFIQNYADTLRQMSVGGVISYIKIGFLTGAPFPLPPLAEQKRIVAKVEELMALVDALEAQQAAADQAATHLLDAVVSELAAAA